MRTIYALSVLSILFLTSCKTDPASHLLKLDLLSHGLPISINAPDGAEVVTDDMGVWKDVTVKAGDNYYVQILGSDATTFEKSDIIADQLKSVKQSTYFSKILEEYEDGFIYEKKIDEVLNYDFRYVKIQGDKEYIFQTGLIGTFSEDDVRLMYDSVK